MTDGPAIYVFVRTDLPLADQIVQVGHVCALAASTFAVPDRCRLILLGLDNVDAIDAVIHRCEEHDIRVASFFEPDPIDDGSPSPFQGEGWGEVRPMGLTALCTEPIDKRRSRPLRRYRLWSGPLSFPRRGSG